MASVLLCGGGTGGHITPLLAVAKELKNQNPDLKLSYIGDKGHRFKSLLDSELFDEVKYISAGKFRRYHRQNILLRLIDINTHFLNLRDLFRFFIGYIQARRYLKKRRPDVIFIKGGFVGVPVGLNAARLKIPYITHDSDALPGLANRLISRKAALHAVALPIENYAYPHEKTRFVGVPIREEFRPVGTKLQAKYKKDLKISENAKLLLVAGGSLGSLRLNKFVTQIAGELLENDEDLIIAHGTGVNASNIYRNLSEEMRTRVIEQQFLGSIYKYSGAADLVITRAGATSLAELAMQQKPSIIIPNPQLTGGHQVKNAQVFAEADAAVVLAEKDLKNSDSRLLLSATLDLLTNKEKRLTLSKNIAKFAKADSAKDLALLILQQIKS